MRRLENACAWGVVFVFALLFATAAQAEDTTRIVSLLPSFTEIAYELGAGDQVVGVSDYCRYPAEARTKPRVGGFLNPSLERILVLKPTVVVLSSSQTDLGEKLRQLNIDVRLFPTDTLQDVFALTLRAGELVGKPTAARVQIKRWQECLDAVRCQVSRTTAPRVLIVVSRQPGSLNDLYVATSQSYIGELIAAAGGRNAIASATRAYTRVSKEELLAANPEVIIDFSLGELANNDAAARQHMAAWKQLPTIQAVREKHVHAIADQHATIPGPYLCTLIAQLAHLLHPDVASPPSSDSF